MVTRLLIWLFLFLSPHTLSCNTNETIPFERIYWELADVSKFALEQETVVKSFKEINKFIRQAQKYGCTREQILTLIEREYGIEVIDAIKRINILQKDIDAIWWDIVVAGFASGVVLCGALILCWYIWPLIAAIKLPRQNGYGSGYDSGGFGGGFGNSELNDNSFGGGGISNSYDGELNSNLEGDDSSLIFSPGSPLILSDEEPPLGGGNADYMNFIED